MESGLKQCSRIGIDFTKRCNWKCQTCFYRWNDDFNTPYDKPIPEMESELQEASRRGCDHAVAVGWGEPGLYKHMEHFIKFSADLGMTTSIITNGSLSSNRYARMYDWGLNHLHVSVHGIGDTLDKIAGAQHAGTIQARTLKWLKEEEKPFRTNTTIQQDNYAMLPEIITHIVEHGAYHCVLLGFLPHYQWQDPTKMKQVAIHPKELKPYIEEATQLLENTATYCTIRYQPLCHLSKQYWKYVTNALYVLYDPWEWDYGHCGKDDEHFMLEAVKMARSVAVDGEPCSGCTARVHCGGWNRHYANGFNGAELQAQDIPAIEQDAGYFFTQNPINSRKGWIE